MHRSIENILGVRLTNLSLESRVAGIPITTDGGPLLRSYGPWYDGDYTALILSLDTGSKARYQATVSYTLADATDNLLNSNLALGLATQGAGSVPTDSLDLEFDRGHSDFTVRHAFVASGYVDLPLGILVSGILRATSGVYFSAAGPLIDYDGDGIRSRRPANTRRNEFQGPATVALDLRVEKAWPFAEHRRVGLLIDLFNVTNARNPLLIDNAFLSGEPGPTFGETRVPQPGREAQIGIRVGF